MLFSNPHYLAHSFQIDSNDVCNSEAILYSWDKLTIYRLSLYQATNICFFFYVVISNLEEIKIHFYFLYHCVFLVHWSVTCSDTNIRGQSLLKWDSGRRFRISNFFMLKVLVLWFPDFWERKLKQFFPTWYVFQVTHSSAFLSIILRLVRFSFYRIWSKLRYEGNWYKGNVRCVRFR